jgi:2'-5' RNA ligase
MVREGNLVVAYWLCLAKPARSHFSSMIADLATRFDAPIFEPHVTVYVTKHAVEEPDAILEQVLKNHGRYCLSVRGLDHSDTFTKTVFVQFEPDPELTRLSSDLRRASAVQDDYELNPHLSLIYKTMSRDQKRDLAASITLPFEEVCFDSMKAVISAANITSREDVEAWRVVATQQLSE